MRTLNNKTVLIISVLIVAFLGYSVVYSVFSLGAQSSQEFLEDPREEDIADFIVLNHDSDQSGDLEESEWAALRDRGYDLEPYDQNDDGVITLAEMTEAADGIDCLLEAAYEELEPRFHHMDVLKQIREDAVREGKRGGIALNTCWECHTSRGRFCRECHQSVNLTLNCFRCHHDPDHAESG
jgi:hypothetical protein